jgi:glutamine amidotransferase
MKSKKVTIVDYGMGNIWSVASAFKYLNCDIEITSDSRTVEKSQLLILPGVGSFKKAMNSLNKLGLDEALTKRVSDDRVKILGICLGMQLMGTSSTEDGMTIGLNLIPAAVDRFTPNEVGTRKIPHVGFDRVQSEQGSILFRNLTGNDDFYFVHSYRMLSRDLFGFLAMCNYGIDFLAAYEFENVYATQFHPEKSQTNGLQLLKNFLSS